MKNLLKFLSLLFFLFLNCKNSFSQCLMTGPNITPGGNQTMSTAESKNGWILPASGTIRILIVFAEIDFTGCSGCDPAPAGGAPGWLEHTLPTWAYPVNQLLDAYPPVGAATGQMTEYFREASFGQLNVIGDYLVNPLGGVFTIPWTQNGVANVVIPNLFAAIAAQTSGVFTTGQSLNNISYFDNWTTTSDGLPKLTPSIDSPNKYDHVMIIWRNKPGYQFQGFAGTTDFTTYCSGVTTLLGYDANTFTFFGDECVGGTLPLNIARHEFSHLLYGSSSFHCGGGGWGEPENYWIPREGGWSNMGLANSSIQTWNAWDRQRMDWKAPGNTYNPAARDPGNTAEVDGDLDATVATQAGTYTLRDFVTTGDALRIKLPFTDPVTEYPEYIWIENHNGTTMNGSSFDKFQYQGLSCVNPEVYGLYMYMQIDRETRLGTPQEVYSGFADYLRPITAEGRYDRQTDVAAGNQCHWWIADRPIIRVQPNALTGDGDMDFLTYDYGNDGQILNSDDLFPYWEQVAGNNIPGLLILGDSRQAFTFSGNKKLGIGTNPSSTSLMNMVSADYPAPTVGIKNLRKVYLNGISIEILNQAVTGEIQVQVKFDDVDIDNDTRWGADEIILNPIVSAAGYSLNIIQGKTLTIDQGKTATRLDIPQNINNGEVFADATTMRCLPNSYLHLESGSTLILDNLSTIELQNLSKIEVESNAKIIVRNNSKLLLQSNSLITVKSGGRLILEGPSFLQIENNARVVIEDGATLEYYPTASIQLNGFSSCLEIGGTLDLKDYSDFTFTYATFAHGYVLFDSPQPVSQNITSGLFCTMNFIGSNQNRKVLEVKQEGLYPPGNLIAFSVQTGTVKLHPLARILPLGAQTFVDFSSAKVTSHNGLHNGHLGLQLMGQPHTLSNSIFEYGDYGIFSTATLGHSDLYADGCTFRNCFTGLYTSDKGVHLNSCIFQNNTTIGWETGVMSNPSSTSLGRVGGNSAQANYQGIYYYGNNTASLRVGDPNITYNNTAGIQVARTSLQVTCGTISNNVHEGIIIDKAATLIMDNGADVTCVGNAYSIALAWANYIYLLYGNNDLTPIIPQSQTAIAGSLISPGPYPIPAKSNKWNNIGNFSSLDYAISFLTVPKTISDPAPLATARLCGQANNPPPPGPQDPDDPLKSCDDCDVITTDDFTNEKLNDATRSAIDKSGEASAGNFVEAVNLFTQILMEDYFNPTSKEKYLLNLNYIKMLGALGDAFGAGQLTWQQNVSTLDATTQKVVDVLDKLNNIAISENNYDRRLIYSLDKAAVYRLADRRDLGLNVLYSISNWVSQDDVSELNHLVCIYDLENQELLGTIPPEAVFYAQNNCGLSPNQRRGHFDFSTTSTMPDEDLNVQVYPVPTSESITLIANIKNGKFILKNAMGQNVFAGTFTSEDIIDVSNLPKGIYTLEVNDIDKDRKKIKKVVIQ